MSLVVIQYIQYGLAITIARLPQWEGRGSFTCSNCFTCLRSEYRRGGCRRQPLSNSCLMTTSTLVSCSVYISKPSSHPILRTQWKIMFIFFFLHSKLFIWNILTINVPLFKKMRDIIFFLRDNDFLSCFEGHFEGANTFFDPQFKGSKKSRPPQNVPRNGSKSFCPKKKKLCPKFS